MAQNSAGSAPASPTWYFSTGTPQCYLTTSVNLQGSGTITPSSGWYNCGSVVTVRATANSGYQFFFFEGDLVGGVTPRTLTLSTSKNVVANFSGQLSGGISPAQLEVNLGPLSLDACDGITTNSAPYVTPSVCSTGQVVQSCIKTVLRNYALQGITGVRSQFGLMGSVSYSTAFNSDGSVHSPWLANLKRFFQDLAAYGITRVTLTPAMGEGWSGPLGSVVQLPYPNTPGCPGYDPNNPSRLQTATQSLYAFPWLPNGLTTDTRDPFRSGTDNASVNREYACGPVNTANFWGWDKMYNLISQIAATAADPTVGITIDEVDLQNEVNLESFAVQARLIYDNWTYTAVFDLLRQALGGSPKVTVSVVTNRPNVVSGVVSICGSVYGDSATVMLSSQLLAATGGAVFGSPPWVSFQGELPCDASVAVDVRRDHRGTKLFH